LRVYGTRHRAAPTVSLRPYLARSNTNIISSASSSLLLLLLLLVVVVMAVETWHDRSRMVLKQA